MEWDFSPVTIGLTVVFYLLIIGMLWKWHLGDGFKILPRIIISIFMLPLTYICVKWQMNK